MKTAKTVKNATRKLPAGWRWVWKINPGMLQQWLRKKKMRKSLQHLGPYKNEMCDYMLARDLIVKKWSGGVFEKELVHLLNAFAQNPCEDSAVNLLLHAPDLIAFFELARERHTSNLFKEKL